MQTSGVMVTVTHWHVHPWFRGPRVLLGVRCKLHPKTQSPSMRGLPPDRVPRRAGRARARGTAYPRAPRRVLEATASEGPVGLLPARGRRTGPPCSRVGLESRGRRPRTGAQRLSAARRSAATSTKQAVRGPTGLGPRPLLSLSPWLWTPPRGTGLQPCRAKPGCFGAQAA